MNADARNRRKVLHRCIKEGLEKGVAETVDFEASTRPVDGYITITGESSVGFISIQIMGAGS